MEGLNELAKFKWEEMSNVCYKGSGLSPIDYAVRVQESFNCSIGTELKEMEYVGILASDKPNVCRN